MPMAVSRVDSTLLSVLLSCAGCAARCVRGGALLPRRRVQLKQRNGAG
jgi:hypothetical protein